MLHHATNLCTGPGAAEIPIPTYWLFERLKSGWKIRFAVFPGATTSLHSIMTVVGHFLSQAFSVVDKFANKFLLGG